MVRPLVGSLLIFWVTPLVKLSRGITTTPPHLFFTVTGVVLGILGAFVYVLAADKDTTVEIVTLNAVLLVLSSVSFSASRAMDPESDAMRQYRQAGEYFLQGSLWLVLVGIFRYAWWNKVLPVAPQLGAATGLLLEVVRLGLLALVLLGLRLPFAIAAAGVSTGFVMLHTLMFQRLGSSPEGRQHLRKMMT